MIKTPYFSAKTNHYNRLFFNVLLWFFLVGTVMALFADFPPKKIDFIYVVSYLITLIPPISLIVYYLVPVFLKKERYSIFMVLVLANIFMFSFVNFEFYEHIIEIIFPDYFFISSYNLWQTILFFTVVCLCSILLRLFEDWVYYNQLEKKRIEEKLKILKGQINPHFLFNSLNVLYSLTIGKNKEATEAILQLSDILRYVLYDSERKTSIEKEIELIKNYIAFEKNRHTKDAVIEFSSKIDKSFEIQPMLLLPLVENSFKHGLKSIVNNPYVKIKMQYKKNNFIFQIENNYKEKRDSKREVTSGIGIQNIKDNLALVYPGKHEFQIINRNNQYYVQLKIDLKK